MNANPAWTQESEEGISDDGSEGELLHEQNQWCPLLEFCVHYIMELVLLETLGVDSCMRVSETCLFATFIAPVPREFQDNYLL